MNDRIRTAVFLLVVAGQLLSSAQAFYTASEVVDYFPGSGVSVALTIPGAALGLPSQNTGSGQWDGNYSPLNPHYAPGEIVQIGAGGQLTVRLERFVRVEPGQKHLGVWENVFLVATSDGTVGNPPAVFGSDEAVVEVSANGRDFVGVGKINFEFFGNYWADSTGAYSKEAGTLRSDFGRPFDVPISQFAGANYQEVLSLLGGTAGGTWIDLSPSGLDRVGWVRFTGVATGFTLEIDSVSINSSLADAPTERPHLRVEFRDSVPHVVLPKSLAHAEYLLQYSDNPGSAWQNAGPSQLGTGGQLVFADNSIPRPAQRFYRVVLP